jgi:hypothetical protein
MSNYVKEHGGEIMKKALIISVIVLIFLLSIFYLVKIDFFFKQKLNIEEVKCGFRDAKTLNCLSITSNKVFVDEVSVTERIMKNYEGWTTLSLDFNGLLIAREDEYVNYLNELRGAEKRGLTK